MGTSLTLSETELRAANLMFIADGKLSAREAMKILQFADADCTNRTIHRRLYRAVAKWKEDNQVPFRPPSEIITTDATAESTCVSSISPGTVPPSAQGSQSEATTVTRSTASTASTTTKRKDATKRTRRTVRQKQISDTEKRIQRAIEDKAFFAAAKMYREELQKPKGNRLSAMKVCEYMNNIHGSHLNPSTLRRKVNNNTDDIAPRSGKKATLPPTVERYLQNAILSYLKLTCVGKEVTPNRKDLCHRLEHCLRRSPWNVHRYDKLVDRLLFGVAPEIEASTERSTVEARRANWSTFTNIDCWFDSLKSFLLDKGFATEASIDDEGELVFLPDQLHRILNVDESEVSTDGTTKLAGGRPVTEYQIRNSAIGKGATKTNKSGYAATFIGGSTVSGYPIPPHFQLKSDAKEAKKKISVDFLKNVPSIQGYYGFNELTQRGITFNANPKAGMDAEEFEKYIKQSIVPLYPDAEDTPSKRVLLIVDSGPGRMNEELLAFLRARGFYMIAGVPNSTHITQATDRNYGLFKSIYRRNLSRLTTERLSKGKTVRPTDIPFLVFGGKENTVELQSAFEEAFSVSKSVSVWADIGINPFTRKCIQDPQVVHELLYLPDGTVDLATDLKQYEILSSQKVNKEAVLNLNRVGCDGNAFAQKAPTNEKRRAIATTAPNTKERQEAIAKAKTAGDRFIVTGGDALNSDDFFVARERQRGRDQIVALKEKKRVWTRYQEIERDATSILEKYEGKTGIDPYTEEGAKGMKKDELMKLFEWKKGRKPQQMNKGALLTAWMESKDKPIAEYETKKWTERDQTDLQRLENKDVAINDTLLGKERQKLIKQSLAALENMSKDEFNAGLLDSDREKLKKLLED